MEKREGKLPAGKTPLSPGDQSNMVFSGALITGGRGTAVVTETGMDTQIGTIASLMNRTVEKKTPLQASLDRFSGHLALGIMGICGVIFLISHPGGSWFHCDHCPGNGNPENGKRACSHKGPESSGKFRLCICDLF